MAMPCARGEAASLQAAADQLATALSHSTLYKNYTQAKAALDQNPALLARVVAYRNAQNAMEYQRLQGDAPPLDEAKRVSHLYATLSLNATASAFLRAEAALLATYKNIFDTLHAACDMV